jgi:hypothetical protein
VIPDFDIRRAALLMMRRYGHDAVAVAVRRADELLEASHMAGRSLVGILAGEDGGS